MKRIMIEQSKCEGCLNCSLACMQAHRTDQGTIYNLNLTDKANETRNFIRLGAGNRYSPLFCRHCAEPECVTACMSGALTKDEANGLVLYNAEQCAACYMCVMNCPYGVLKPDDLTHSKVIKCDFCLEQNAEPSCVKSCPMQAIFVEEV